jgi:hypothetical protein
MCERCTNADGTPMEFSYEEYQKHIKNGHKIDKPQVIPTTPPPTIQIKEKELELVYKYIGNCPTCHAPVDTIPLESTKEKIIVVAWCPACKKNLKQRGVEKL